MAQKLLDLGCGNGNNIYGFYQNPDYSVTGIDIEMENVDICQKKFPDSQFFQVDGVTLPFEDGAFDIIQSLDVLEHVDDIEAVLWEAYRVLKKWWKFIVEVPYWKSEEMLLKIKPSYWDDIHHVRMFRDGEMEAIMEKFGWKLLLKKWRKHFDNISLAWYFRHGDILNQKGDMSLPHPLLRRWFQFSRLPYYLVYRIFQTRFDAWFPKSVYFEFIKR
jgi:ubiquinone/menaquinone biosynthesis C-methylase UbiE